VDGGDRRQHPLEQRQPLIQPAGRQPLEGIRRAWHRRRLAVRLERLAAAPFGEVEQPGWIIHVLIQPSVTPSCYAAGWKRKLLDRSLNHRLDLVWTGPKLAQDGDAQT